MLLTPGDQLENWRIESLLGEGGMGSVYRGHSTMLQDVRAAIKVTRPSDFQHARERFMREIKALLKLHHPSVVRVQGFGEDQERGLLWFAMDLVDGEPLDETNARGAMPLDRALPFFINLADGLAHAHERGVAHRDLKPANIIVRSDGSPVLVDFGISAATGDNQLTKTGGVIGTPQYLPPEALDGRLQDPMVGDIYALGQVMMETIAGRSAFPFDPQLTSTQNALRIMHNKVQVGPLDPGEAIPDVLRGIVIRATHPDPSARTPRASEVAAQLRAAASGSGIPWGGPTLLPVTGETRTAGAPATMELDPAPAPRKRRAGGLLLGGAALIAVLAVLGVGVIAVAGGALWWLSTQDRAAQAQAIQPDGDLVGEGDTAAADAAAELQVDATPDPVSGAPEPPAVATGAPSGPTSAPNPLLAGQPAPNPLLAGQPAPNPLDSGRAPTGADLGAADGDIVDDPVAQDAAADLGPPDGDIVDELVEPTPNELDGDAVAEVAVVAPPPAPSVRRMRPNWGTMAGVQKGMGDSALERILGPGTGSSSPYCRTGEMAKAYLDSSVVVCRRIGIGGARRIQVTRRVLAHRSKLPDDAKLELLGMSEADLKAAIGDPSGRDGSGRWRYEYNRVIFDFAGGEVRSVVVEL